MTVAAEYCAFIVKSGEKRGVISGCSFQVDTAALSESPMLPEVTSEGLYLEESVTEPEYDRLRLSLSALLADADDYLEVFVEEMKYSDTPVRKCISEDLSDIYQALKNFICSYRSGLDDIMREALAVY